MRTIFPLILRLLFDKRVPLKLKAIPLLAILYVLLPFDFLPDFIPLLGWIDDIAVVVISILTFLLGINKMKIVNIIKNNPKKINYDKIFISLKNNTNVNIFIKNNWKSPTKIRLIKFIFEKATIYCDENETLYKIKIYKSFKNKFNEHTLEVPKIDLTEPLNNLAKYILKTLNKKKKIIFNDKFNLSITKLMIALDKK